MPPVLVSSSPTPPTVIEVHKSVPTSVQKSNSGETVRDTAAASMRLCAVTRTPLSSDSFCARPVLSSRQWCQWAAHEGRLQRHTVTIDVSRNASIACSPVAPIRYTPSSQAGRASLRRSREVSPHTEVSDALRVAHADALPDAEYVHAVNLFLPQNQYLHFYARHPSECTRGAAQAEDAAIRDEATSLLADAETRQCRRRVETPESTKRKVGLVAYRRSGTLEEMHTQSLAAVPLPTARRSGSDGQAEKVLIDHGPQRVLRLRRQLPRIALASSLWQSSGNASSSAPPSDADYPIIRVVPLFFSSAQICTVGTSPTAASSVFRRTWGLKQVNTHAEARRSGSTTPPPQASLL